MTPHLARKRTWRLTSSPRITVSSSCQHKVKLLHPSFVGRWHRASTVSPRNWQYSVQYLLAAAARPKHQRVMAGAAEGDNGDIFVGIGPRQGINKPKRICADHNAIHAHRHSQSTPAGERAEKFRGILSLKYPMEHGIVLISAVLAFSAFLPHAHWIA